MSGLSSGSSGGVEDEGQRSSGDNCGFPMQGQRGKLESYDECGSGSGNSGSNQHLVWNNMPNGTLENQNLSVFPISNDATSTIYGNIVSHQSTNSNLHAIGGPSLNLLPPINGTHDELELEIRWRPSVAGSTENGSRMGGNRLQLHNAFSFENADIDLNRNDIDNSHLCLQISDFNGHSQNLDYNAQHVCVNSQVLDPGLSSQPSSLRLPHPQHDFSGGSSHSIGSSLQGVQPFPSGYRGKHAVPLDHHQLISNKRKSGGVPGQSSMSANSGSFNQCPPTQDGIKAMGSNHQAFGRQAENEEPFQRNTRMRTDPGNLNDASGHNTWPQVASISHSNSLSVHPVSSILSNQSMESRLGGSSASLQIQHRPNVAYSISGNDHPVPWDEIPSTRLGESSRSRAFTVGRSAVAETLSRTISRDNNVASSFSGNDHPVPWDEIPSTRLGESSRSRASTVARSVAAETLSRTVSRDSIAQHPVIVPLPSTRPLAANMSNIGFVNGSAVTPQNIMPPLQTGSNVGFHQPLADQASTSRLRRLSEIHALSQLSESRIQSLNLPPPRVPFPIPQEIGRNQTGIVLNGQHQPHMNSQISAERQNGIISRAPTVQSLAASMERRSRILAEFINRHNIFRGDNLTLQDVMVFEHSLLHRGAFVDRHRDMRLDVDNMSYEELLALEERIGSVNTGLSEEKIMKCLKRREYAPIAPEPATEIEPCCICREDYLEGEDLGRLDCGHDFHTECVKQWLVIKNLCPICKTAAFST